jgi:hypothetical protein
VNLCARSLESVSEGVGFVESVTAAISALTVDARVLVAVLQVALSWLDFGRERLNRDSATASDMYTAAGRE